MSEVAPDDRFTLTHLVARKRVGFAAVQGEVVAIERWTETQTSSAPGSVHIYGNQVTVVPPKVWATAVGRKALWIKTEADEIQVPVPESLQVRQGHRVHAVVSTGPGRNGSQWAAIVNHDTSRWTQVDRYPPCDILGVWSSIVVGFGQGTGNVFGGAMGLYGFLFGVAFACVGQSGSAFVTGLIIGMGVGFTHGLVVRSQADAAVAEYLAGVTAACDQVFAASK